MEPFIHPMCPSICLSIHSSAHLSVHSFVLSIYPTDDELLYLDPHTTQHVDITTPGSMKPFSHNHTVSVPLSVYPIIHIHSSIHPFFLSIHSFYPTDDELLYLDPHTTQQQIKWTIHSSYLSLYLSIHSFIHSSYLSLNLSIHSFIRSFVCSFIRSSVQPSACMSFRLFIHSSIHPSIHLPICQFIHSSVSIPQMMNCYTWTPTQPSNT